MSYVNIFYCYYWLIKVVVNTSIAKSMRAAYVLLPAHVQNSIRRISITRIFVILKHHCPSFHIPARSRKRAFLGYGEACEYRPVTGTCFPLRFENANAYSTCTYNAYSTKVFSS